MGFERANKARRLRAPNGTAPPLNPGWHPVNGGEYFAYWDGTTWTSVRTPRPAQTQRIVVNGRETDSFNSTFLAIIAAVIVIAIVGGIGYAVVKSNDDLEKMREETTRLNCDLNPSGPECP